VFDTVFGPHLDQFIDVTPSHFGRTCHLKKSGHCAPCQGVDLQWVQLPPGKGSLQPVAIGAATSATMLSKPLMERIGKRFGEQPGRNVSER
jgi:hypothetical protein